MSAGLGPGLIDCRIETAVGSRQRAKYRTGSAGARARTRAGQRQGSACCPGDSPTEQSVEGSIMLYKRNVYVREDCRQVGASLQRGQVGSVS